MKNHLFANDINSSEKKDNKAERMIIMKTFTYIIQDEVGIHARPAGMLAKKAKEYSSKVTIHKGEKSAEASKLMALMSLGIKCGDEATVTVEGEDEETAARELEEFFCKHL